MPGPDPRAAPRRATGCPASAAPPRAPASQRAVVPADQHRLVRPARRRVRSFSGMPRGTSTIARRSVGAADGARASSPARPRCRPARNQRGPVPRDERQVGQRLDVLHQRRGAEQAALGDPRRHEGGDRGPARQVADQRRLLAGQEARRGLRELDGNPVGADGDAFRDGLPQPPAHVVAPVDVRVQDGLCPRRPPRRRAAGRRAPGAGRATAAWRPSRWPARSPPRSR